MFFFLNRKKIYIYISTDILVNSSEILLHKNQVQKWVDPLEMANEILISLRPRKCCYDIQLSQKFLLLEGSLAATRKPQHFLWVCKAHYWTVLALRTTVSSAYSLLYNGVWVQANQMYWLLYYKVKWGNRTLKKKITPPTSSSLLEQDPLQIFSACKMRLWPVRQWRI